MTTERYAPHPRGAGCRTPTRSRARWLDRGRAVRDGCRRAGLRLRQRAPPPCLRPARVPDRPRPGHQRRLDAIRGRQGVRAAGAVGPRGVGVARTRGGPASRRYWARATGSTRCARSETGNSSIRRSRSAMCRGTRPTHTPAGRASACRPRRSGRRQPHGIRPLETPLPSVGRAVVDGARGEPGPARFRRAHRRPHMQAGESPCGMRMRSAACGNGPQAGSSPTAASVRSPTPSTRRSSSGGRTGSCAEARGRPGGCGLDDLPQLGPPGPPADIRRVQVCGGRGGGMTQITAPGRIPCASTCTWRTARLPRWPTTSVPGWERTPGDPAEVLLRRARVRAVRADHHAARVLPHAVEQAILDAAGAEIVELVQPTEIVELGPGSARKTDALLLPDAGGWQRGAIHPRRRVGELGRAVCASVLPASTSA